MEQTLYKFDKGIKIDYVESNSFPITTFKNNIHTNITFGQNDQLMVKKTVLLIL